MSESRNKKNPRDMNESPIITLRTHQYTIHRKLNIEEHEPTKIHDEHEPH
jgi:hypothetical protein